MLLGNVLKDWFVLVGGTVRNPGDACNKILQILRMSAKELQTSCPIGSLTKGMIGMKKPRLKCKAAESRYLLPIVFHALECLWDKKDEYEHLRYNCVQSLSACYNEIANWVSDGSSRARLGKYARQHLLLYGELSKKTPKGRWHLIPKHHLFLHLAEEGGANPRLEWNYMDESEIGDAAKFALHCSAKHFAKAFIERYALCFRW